MLCTREDAVVMVKVKKSDEQVEWSGRWMILYTHTHTRRGGVALTLSGQSSLSVPSDPLLGIPLGRQRTIARNDCRVFIDHHDAEDEWDIWPCSPIHLIQVESAFDDVR